MGLTGDEGTQVWARDLADGAVAVGLYNKEGNSLPPIPTGPCDTWTKTEGGYLEACGGGSGNVGTFSGQTLEETQEACCQNDKCAGFSFAQGSGYYKGNQNCGKVQNSQYEG